MERLGDGKFRTTGQVLSGRDIDWSNGVAAADGVRIVVTSKRMQAFDQAPFRHLGIEPARILALKSICHFRAEFELIAQKVIVVLADGYHLVDSSAYPFEPLRPDVWLKPLGNATLGSAA